MLGDESGKEAAWGGFEDRLAEATGCGVLVYSRVDRKPTAGRGPGHDQALEELTAVLGATGFERGLLLGHGTGATVATLYAGGVADHRVRGLVLVGPCFFDGNGRGESAWDIRESIGYIRVPIQIVRGDGPGAIGPAHVEAAEEEAYCPVEVATIAGAGPAPHAERPAETLAVVATFVETLFVAAGEAAAFPLRKGSHGS
jgi:pimeloyl-ACP methyl ester carboxylesterase